MSVQSDPFSPEVLRERVAKWAASPEGQRAIKETAKQIKKAQAAFLEASRIDPEELRKPMTI
mgnify:CR=1 FL=1